MQKSIIDGNDFYRFVKSGAVEVSNQKETLNRINVFPVQDGDTGTNLVMTMNSIVEEVEVTNDFDTVIKSMSDVAFESARGNSGIIFASFINGFSSACGHLKSLTMEQFGSGAETAALEAYASVSVPVEGTMLTVIRAWSTYIKENHKRHHYFNDLFEAAYEKAKHTLEETPDMLEVLKKNKVVDSGAKGFVIFLEGVNRFLADLKHSLHEEHAENVRVVPAASEEELDLDLRYCTEVLIQASIQEKARIEALLHSQGDSLIVTGNDHLVKVHLHTKTPEKVSQLLIDEGFKIRKSKVDDMLLQHQIEVSQRSKIAILTDSIADIGPELVMSEQIHQIALGLFADENMYLDKVTVNEETISRILEESAVYPTSSQPDVKAIRARLEWLTSRYDAVIVISVSKALSGTYNSFEKAIAPYVEKGYPIHLVDSKLNTSGQGMLVLNAARMANAGKSVDAILKAIEEDIPKTDIYVSLDTFKYAVKSGRVPNKIGKALMALGAKPIMSLDRAGKGTAFGLAFSRKGIDKKIMKVVNNIREHDDIRQYTIVHANNPDLATHYAKRFEALLGKKPEYICSISSVTTIHAGIGSVAIALVRGSL